MSTSHHPGSCGTFTGPQSRIITLAKLRPEGIRIRPIGLENSLEAIVAEAPCAIALLDDDFRHVAASDSYCRALHTNRAAILGRAHKEAFSVLPQNWEAMLECCLAGESVISEGEWSGPDHGQRFHIQCQFNPWRRSRSKIGGTILFVKEATLE